MKPIHAIGLALVLAVGAAPATAQDVAWNQAEVSKIADELVATVGQIQVTSKSDTTPEVKEELRPALNDIADFKKEVRYLAQELRGGKGRAETWPRANRCRVILARVRTHGAEEPLVKENEANIAKAEELIAQLRGFYGADPPDVATPPAPE